MNRGYVYGIFNPGSEDRKEDPALGLIAHMDTSPAACGANVKPSVVLYEGGDIPLGKKRNLSESKGISLFWRII